MAGYVNSWIEQYTGVNPTPCIGDTVQQTTNNTTLAGSCILWLIAGLVFGSLKFEKKGTHQP